MIRIRDILRYESRVKKNLKEMKITHTNKAFLFGGSILGTPKLLIIGFEQSYVGWTF